MSLEHGSPPAQLLQVQGCVPGLRAKTETLSLPLPTGLITLSFEQLVSIWMLLEQLGQCYWGEWDSRGAKPPQGH